MPRPRVRRRPGTASDRRRVHVKFRTEPLSALFIKIRYTMPPNAAEPEPPPQLTPEQGADLVAHVLKSNGFPAGKTDFAAADATTSRIALARRACGGADRHRRRGQVSANRHAQPVDARRVLPELESALHGADARPGGTSPSTRPAAKGAGFSVFEWGQGIYTGWPVIENAAAALADASPWMLSPGIRIRQL